jgi:hypothetical protein
MITSVLIISHIFSKNKDFKPDILYIGTLMLDLFIINSIFGQIPLT